MFFECGQCGHYHSIDLPNDVDCRNDSTRFTLDQLEETYGQDGFDYVTIEDMDQDVNRDIFKN